MVCRFWRMKEKLSLFAVKVMKGAAIRAISYYFLFWKKKREDINTGGKGRWIAKLQASEALHCSPRCCSHTVWQGTNSEEGSVFNFKLLSRRPSRIICSVNSWSGVLAFLFVRQTVSQMLNVREEPMACVFYQLNLLPRISLDFCFSDAI